MKAAPRRTALELAADYSAVAREMGLGSIKKLAAHLGRPYRTVKSVMELLTDDTVEPKCAARARWAARECGDLAACTSAE